MIVEGIAHNQKSGAGTTTSMEAHQHGGCASKRAKDYVRRNLGGGDLNASFSGASRRCHASTAAQEACWS